MALYADTTEALFYYSAASPATRQLEELGLELIRPDGEQADINEDFSGFFGETVSLEELDRYRPTCFCST